MSYKGIIFDFNGTLLFDSQKHYDAWKVYSKILRGTSFSDDEMRKHMFGRTNEDIITYAIGKKPDAQLCAKYAREKEQVYRDMCIADKENFHLAPYAEDFLNYICQNNIPHTIATMSEWDNVEFYIKELNLPKWFDVEKIVYDDGTIPGKPQPDIYLKAANKLGLEPKDCIVVEDAISGINAAYAAGIGKIIAIASLESPDIYKELPYVNQIIKDFSNFDEILK
jgi:beta-phosphoglucomutase-like phosphatase (HAD superfamily)